MASEAAARRRRHHALAVPLPGQGHVNPLMRFCKKLAEQEGFTITFVHITGAYFNFQRQELDGKQKDGEDEGVMRLDIRRTHVDMPDPSELGSLDVGAGPIQCGFAALGSISPQIEQLLLQPHDPPITCLISDVFLTGPTQSVADKFNLPRIAFYTCSQSLLLLANYIREGVMSLEDVLKALEARERLKDNIFKEGLPGLPTIKVCDLMEHFQENRFLYTNGFQVMQETTSKARAIAINTFTEIEEDALQVDTGIPIYAIGPLVEPLENELNTSLLKEDEACMVWLDSQPCSSVLFVSFGSFAPVSLPQFEEFIAGFLSSKQRILWVFRPNLVKDAPFTTFPEEVLSKFHGRAYVTNWVPQVKVLSHPSVGGFLTHCGWNSTLEAISHGVPMLCFPYIGDQFLNAKFIIEEWKVGLGFKENKESGLIGREEITRVIQTLLETEEGECLHHKADSFRNACARSYLPTGGAFNNIQAIVSALE
ncbi:hypothetical protein GOP47_0007499 [Adiantum capillus-veneris]|uniref:Glycosyltransferase n=1 Tax=Adiantum capillus-veneris TaxID=13818 RepID=A0A9D4V1E3_ADICA|nr:hypothetical protein GOP47_0007499 [Adiantum capillus-veneris]